VGAVDEAKELVDGTIRGTLYWRLFVTGSILALLAALAWAFGLLPFLGPGFAHAGDVNDVKKELSSVKQQVAGVHASQIAEKIDAVTTSLCMEGYNARLLDYRNELQRQHRELTGSEHQSPPCEILLKLKR
jgi:hypothetical protein